MIHGKHRMCLRSRFSCRYNADAKWWTGWYSGEPDSVTWYDYAGIADCRTSYKTTVNGKTTCGWRVSGMANAYGYICVEACE